MPVTSFPDALNGLLHERWAFFHDRIVHRAATDGAVPLADPDASDALNACFERWCRGMPGEDRRGLGSLWAQWYAVTVWPPLVTGILLLGTAPRLTSRDTRLLVDADGCPSGLRIATDVRIDDPAALFDRLIHHAEPLIDTIATATATAPRVPWSNVANVTGWMLGELHAVADDATLAPGYDLLARRQRPDGCPNPLYTGACHAPATGRPARRVCCLRYRLTGFDYCGDCPITCRCRPTHDS
ncbi:MAG: siderophore-iron reductase FhuF [Halofilum sp. (in: g-proteobacteria)]